MECKEEIDVLQLHSSVFSTSEAIITPKVLWENYMLILGPKIRWSQRASPFGHNSNDGNTFLVDSLFFPFEEQFWCNVHILLGTCVVAKASYAFSNYLLLNRHEMRKGSSDVRIAALDSP
eukprot:TRINITY_DN11371_c0_g1_i1.p1 TRINITY_DN11371_c0_g1~~TRINITY_DN11371_c0_g1_i1.p1  ORF type:complete len:120 (-),score=0.23 TRINITY_DN11371_c0_g1_i1:53-412(-)